MKSGRCSGGAFIPVSLRAFPGEHRVSFPPVAKGGPGGVIPAQSITDFSNGLFTRRVPPLKPRCDGSESHSRCPRRPPPPPRAPPSQGGERDRSAVLSCHLAQQKHPSTNRRFSPVMSNFSSAPPGTPLANGGRGRGSPLARKVLFILPPSSFRPTGSCPGP
jgi:hypothetical protein